MDEKLAINGGEPLVKTPFPPYFPGAMLYDEEEASSASSVITAKSPFRYYGPNCLFKVKEFEQEMAKKIGVKHALAVSSGTSAVIVALKAAGIGPGDKVIVPACTFIATAGAVVCAGAVPVFAEIDESLSIDPNKLEDLIDKGVKAIIPVPILGNPCEMDKIMEIANKHNLIVIEDAAQSCGAKYKGKAVGSFGHINTFSLQMNKILTTGEGGIVVTNDKKLYERAVRYHDQGMFREEEGFLSSSSESDVFIGQNYRLSEISGAVALTQLGKLDAMIGNMRKIKKMIKSELTDVSGLGFRRINDEEGEAGNAIIFLVEDKKKVDLFIKALKAEGLPVNPLYKGQCTYMQPQILYQKTADPSGFPFNQFDPPIKYSEDMCPVSVDIMARNISLSIGTTWTEKHAEYIVKGFKKVASQIL